jgi:hypothetical protein
VHQGGSRPPASDAVENVGGTDVWMAAGVDYLERTVYTELSQSLEAMENTLQCALHLPTNTSSFEASSPTKGLFPKFLGIAWAALPLESGSDYATAEGFTPKIAFKLPKRKHVVETRIGRGAESEEGGKDVAAVQSNLEDARKTAANTRASFGGEAAQLSEALEKQRSEGWTLAQQRDAHHNLLVDRCPRHATILELLHDELCGTLQELSGEVESLKKAVATVTKQREEQRKKGASDAEERQQEVERRRPELGEQLLSARAKEAAGGCLSTSLPPGPDQKPGWGGGLGQEREDRRARQLPSLLTLDLGLDFTRPSEPARNTAHVHPVWV